MSAQLFTVPYQCVVVNGLAEPGATLTFYRTETTTKIDIYTTAALDTPHPNPITALGSGALPPIYLDTSETYRVVIKNRAGTTVTGGDIDPYIPGVTTLGITLTSATGQSVSTLGALAALSSPVNHQVAFLSQSARAGMFEFDSSNLSAYVAADTAQGVYVAPASATSGASGAWVRRYSGPLDIRWFGAIADCTTVGVGTDNYNAINCAMSVGALTAKSSEILVPKAALGYRVGSTLVFTYGVKLTGQGYHENPGQVGATSYTAPAGLPGSVLVFDANTAGLKFVDFTDNAANAAAYEFEGARFSVVQDLRLYGGGGTSTTAHGVETRTIVDFRNVNIIKFGGNGLYIVANTAGSDPYGNASNSVFTHVKLLSNGCHGAQISGIDSNIITFTACHFANNGGAGVFDQSYIGGNAYFGCQFATNNASYGAGTAQTTKVQADTAVLSASASNGSIVCDNASNTPHVFSETYVETGNGHLAHLPAGCLVIGGILSNAGSYTATSAPMVLDPSAGGKFTCSALLGRGGTLLVTAADVALDAGQVVRVNGSQVVGPRQTGCPAAAVDPATTMALVNFLRSAALAHGSVAT
jgi:hypothetical protein